MIAEPIGSSDQWMASEISGGPQAGLDQAERERAGSDQAPSWVGRVHQAQIPRPHGARGAAAEAHLVCDAGRCDCGWCVDWLGADLISALSP